MRFSRFFSCVVAFACFLATPSAAHAQQSVTIWAGGFVPHGEDARARDEGTSQDVLVNNRDFLVFNINDFTGATIGGEWLVQLNDHLDAGLGLGFYRRTVPTIYQDFVNR